MNSFIARQPIFDNSLRVYAYELLYRNSSVRNEFDQDTDMDQASTEVMIRSFQDMGVEKLTNGRRAFINFTANLVKGNFATLFPNDLLVVEILENIEPTEEIIEACAKIKKNGYLIALDDFKFSEKFKPLVELADVIKIDFLASGLGEIRDIISKVDTKKTKLLAEKIENKEMYEFAKDMGFSLFQGYFFSKPVILSEKTLDPLKVNYMRLIRYVNQPDMDFERVAAVVRYDVALAYRLLRLVNSAFFGFMYEIKNIRHALAILGTRETRKWVTLITLMGMQDDKPDEIIRMSMVRARFLELMGSDVDLGIKGEQLHIAGLFSLIDVIMDRPKEEVLNQLNLPHQVCDALLNGAGPLAKALDIIGNYERGLWDESMRYAEPFGLSQDEVIKYYLDSIIWCNSMII